jgi:hypothetical protein
MQEPPHLAILDREVARAAVDEHFAAQTALLRDVANYGSNLVVRSFEASPRAMADIIICGVLLKQVVAMIDALEVLLSAGCGNAAFLPARTAFEASVYIDWIMKSDSERRATRYLVANLRDERHWAKVAIPGTAEANSMNAVTSLLGLNVNSNRQELAADATNHLAEINRILAQGGLKAIDKEFDMARKGKMHDPAWYELDDVASVRQLAKLVNRLPEYTFFYSKGSQVAHSGRYKDHLRFGNQEVRFVPVRHIADINMLLNHACTSAFSTYKKVLERYRPGEVSAFGRKYLEDWQRPFMNAKDVNYVF